MDNDGSLLERLRQQLANLEANQRRSGGTATAGFWSTLGPDAAQPALSDAAEPGAGNDENHENDAVGSRASDARADAAGPAATGSTRSGGPGGVPLPFTLDWGTFTAVRGRLAPTFAFAAGITAVRGLNTTSLEEADLITSATQLGQLQQHREVALLRIVTEMDARGVASPGGLSRLDWLRQVDPTLTASAAKAIVTCAAAFNQPRWAQLRDAVTGETNTTSSSTDITDSGTDTTDGTDRIDDIDGTDGDDGTDGSGRRYSSADPHAERVTVGKAAQVIDFFHRLKPVADPDDLDHAVTHLTEQAPGLRWEQLGKLARELVDQVRPPKDADDHDQKRREGRGLWFTGPNAAGMVGMTGTLDPEGAATLQAAIDPLSAPCPLIDEAGVRIEDDPRAPHQRRMDALLDLVARGVSSPGDAPSTDKAKIVVTMNFEALREFVANGCPPHWATSRGSGGKGTPGAAGKSGSGGGSCLSGDVLSAAMVRRLACDAAIIPVILGSDSQPLDVGREERLVTRAMRTALWLRDKGCSFPGCSTPAQWTDAHHVKHWLHGGTTCLGNLALLCRRHHVYVHEKDLTATITNKGVTWHTWQHWRTTVGSDPPPTAPPIADVRPTDRLAADPTPAGPG
ncbi:MAG: HNH endonuclease [Humibacillus sp.]|nr:HNH endonuclease [Humibacillus sp.]